MTEFFDLTPPASTAGPAGPPLGPGRAAGDDLPNPDASRHPATRRFLASPMAVAGLIGVSVFALTAMAGGRVWHYRYDSIGRQFSTPPSWAHPMGTDDPGHDLLAQVLRGAQKSLQVAFLVATASTVVGVAIGAVAGFYRGKVEAVLMRATDLVLTIPGIAVLAVLAEKARRPAGNWWEIGLVIAAISWPGMARIVRATVVSLREQEFVEAARASGATDGRIITRHLLPLAAGPIAVRATLSVGAAVLVESSLSYLGIGIRSPDTSLGILVANGQHAATTRPWLFWFPGLCIVVLVLSVNLVGDGLRDALDPGPSRISPERPRRRRVPARALVRRHR